MRNGDGKNRIGIAPMDDLSLAAKFLTVNLNFRISNFYPKPR